MFLFARAVGGCQQLINREKAMGMLPACSGTGFGQLYKFDSVRSLKVSLPDDTGLVPIGIDRVLNPVQSVQS